MIRRTDIRRLVLLLSLTLFQVQVMASWTLGCLHADEPAASAPTCPMHAAAASADTSAGAPVQDQPQGDADASGPSGTSLLDCPKCALGIAIGQFDHHGAEPLWPLSARQAEPCALRAGHFYRFRPESFLRPPIAAAV
ncbi:hypothetical protein F2Q65_08950 [Thiohalocapsa marina]|uniref:DUF2946 domain-containing protein n=1 Tax=Thiohalocapsa marina TaxID=424902 RepID=A0A5M8FKE6_9GAMM|nr:hypothetical protein [Thiohalocapsa marina]KAA6185393.1 hypothetical protein F2Q65_08950 [Thiohalocapsa marina]